MTDERFLGKYRIPSTRLQGDYYNNGNYFVTICTAQREPFFGNIETGNSITEPKMILSPIGQYASEQLLNARTHYPYAEIPLFVIMPNHIHAIIVIDDCIGRARVNCRNVSREKCGNVSRVNCENVSRVNCENVSREKCRDGARPVSTVENQIINKKMQAISQKKGLLSVVVGGIKSSITRYANLNNIPFGWQSRFHEHIVRSAEEMNEIATYINNNVLMWDEDEFYG